MKEISLIKSISNGDSKIILLILHNVYFQYLLFMSKEGIKITLNFLCDKYINIASNIVHFILSLEWIFFFFFEFNYFLLSNQ
jgi:hypothetical protein